MQRTVRDDMLRQVTRSLDREFVKRLCERRSAQISTRRNDSPIGEAGPRRLESSDRGPNRDHRGKSLLPAGVVRVEGGFARGDAVLIRTGRWPRRELEGQWDVLKNSAGLHASCLPWLKKRDVAVVGSDLALDVLPSGVTPLTAVTTTVRYGEDQHAETRFLDGH